MRVVEPELCFCTSYSLRQNVRVLGDLLLRSGDNISPKRENEDVRLCFGYLAQTRGSGFWATSHRPLV